MEVVLLPFSIAPVVILSLNRCQGLLETMYYYRYYCYQQKLQVIGFQDTDPQMVILIPTFKGSCTVARNAEYVARRKWYICLLA